MFFALQGQRGRRTGTAVSLALCVQRLHTHLLAPIPSARACCKYARFENAPCGRKAERIPILPSREEARCAMSVTLSVEGAQYSDFARYRDHKGFNRYEKRCIPPSLRRNTGLPTWAGWARRKNTYGNKEHVPWSALDPAHPVAPGGPKRVSAKSGGEGGEHPHP